MAAVCLVCFILKLSKLILTDKIGIPLKLTAIVTSFIIQRSTINTITISFMFTFFHENWRCSICFYRQIVCPTNFCQFSIQIFCPFFANFFLKKPNLLPIFCPIFCQLSAHLLPIFCLYQFSKTLSPWYFFQALSAILSNFWTRKLNMTDWRT